MTPSEPHVRASTQLVEVLGQQPGFITSSGRKWDAANGLWVNAEGLDRKSLAQSHFVIAHFGAMVPYNAGLPPVGLTALHSLAVLALLHQREPQHETWWCLACCVTRGAEGFCDKNADPFDGDLLRLMTGDSGSADKRSSLVSGPAADFTRTLFSKPASVHRSISFKACSRHP